MGQSYFSSQLSFPLSAGKKRVILRKKSLPTKATFAFGHARRQRACVSDDVIKDDESLKLQLELTVGVFRQRLGFKPPEPEICILVSINKELKRTDLDGRPCIKTLC